jgi:hypothetical protein
MSFEYCLSNEEISVLASLALEVLIQFKEVLHVAKTHPYYMQFGLCWINQIVEDDLQPRAMWTEAVFEAWHRWVIKHGNHIANAVGLGYERIARGVVVKMNSAVQDAVHTIPCTQV